MKATVLSYTVSLSFAAALFVPVPRTLAAELWTTNAGVDSGSCGSTTSPCRSISQAIANASDGDKIVVGPGHYGDVNGDGTFTGPGDEQPSQAAPTGCVVCITKAVHIYSTQGASVTVIEAPSLAQFASTVMILHDGVDFGDTNYGFTITGGNTNGVLIDIPSLSVIQNVSVKGNIDLSDTNGFVFRGRDYNPQCPGGQCQLAARILIADNQAINNSRIGFSMTANYDLGPGQIIVLDNVALGAGTGFAVLTGYQGIPGAIDDAIFSLTNNIASHGTIGFYASLPGAVEYNTALDNSQVGFILTPGSSTLFSGNSAIGNGGPGVVVNYSSDAFSVQNGVFQSFTGNNFLGNDRSRSTVPLAPTHYGDPWEAYNTGPGAHCGVLNLGSLTALFYGPQPSPSISLQASGNYWGSTYGPEATGPGDNVGGSCDENGGATVAKPFTTTANRTTAPPVEVPP